MCSCAFESLISIPLFEQQAVPSFKAEIANILRIDVFAPSISFAAFFVN